MLFTVLGVEATKINQRAVTRMLVKLAKRKAPKQMGIHENTL